MIGSRICSAGSWTTAPNTTTDWTVTISTCNNLSQRFSHPHRCCLRHGFIHCFRSQMILLCKQSIQLRLDLFKSKFFILCRQITDQDKRIMLNRSDVISVFLMSRFFRFHIVDPLLQISFQLCVIQFRFPDCLIR